MGSPTLPSIPASSATDGKTQREIKSADGSARQLRTSVAQKEKKVTASPPPPLAATAPQAASSVSLPSGTVDKSASQDAEDFFARAKAMGLNLTRQDYERARAGVSAFLRAQRVDKTDSVGGTAGENKVASTSSNGGNNDAVNHSTSDRSPAIANPGSGKLTSQGKLAAANRSAGSPMLSFFTAVIPSEEDEAKVRPSLDDVGAMEEKKRRRERRRRLRLRQEILEKEGGPARSHVKTLSHSSSALDTSPLTSVSAETGPARDTSSMPPPTRFVPTTSSIGANQGHIGLGLQIDGSMKAMIDEQEGQEVEALLRSPVRLLPKESTTISDSPSLRKLSQKAHIDLEGRLTLMPTPERLNGRLASADTLLSANQDMLEDEEMLAPVNAGGADTDDSGVFFNVEPPLKKDWHRHERDSSDDTSPIVDLHESLNRMGFLDRVMAQKKSPARLRREARAKRKETERGIASGNNDLVVMVATTAPSSAQPSTTSTQSALLPPPPPPSSRNQIDRLDVSQAKNVRWARGTSSPRERMTTKEHYDFAFYGIAPTAEMGAHFPIFDDEVDHKRMSTESSSSAANDASHLFQVRQRTTSVWMKNASGSPVASRNSMTGVNDSPGVLSMQFDNMTDHGSASNHFTARRGLLFGSSSNEQTPSRVDQPDLLSNLSNRSPARTVFDAYTAATSPATSMTRAHTLAAPFSYHQNSLIGSEKSPRASIDESPDKVMLMRAYSSGALGRRLSNVARRDGEEDKENHPTGDSADQQSITQRLRKASIGWTVQRSPMSKYDTISPAALFGMSSGGNRIRVLSGDIAEMGRLPLEASKTQRGKIMDENHSDEEGDDEREVDASPTSAALNDAGRSSPVKVISKKHFEKSRGHARDSSASTSAFEDSPMYLDIGNKTASIVSTVASASDLARALGMHTEEGQVKKAEANQQSKGGVVSSKKKRKALQQQQQGQEQSEIKANASGESTARFVAPLDSTIPLNPALGRMEWDKPDGSRVIKLISEELQAALESGQIAQEPPPRYYKLPSDWGRSKSKPQSVSYAGMIGQAILSSSDGRLSLNEIYNWISTVFPFFERGDRGWQNSIRHNLSLNKSFIKVERDANVPGKGGWWAIKEGHEDRFRGGSYIAPGSALSQKTSSIKGNKGSSSQGESSAVYTSEDLGNAWPKSSQEETTEVQSTRRKRQESDQSEMAASEYHSETDLPASQSQQSTATASTKQHASSVSSKKSKKVKLVSGASKRSMEHGDHMSAHPGNMAIGEERVPLRVVQSSSSPRGVSSHYDSITPSRSYNYTASSGHGSASTTSMMGNMPMLTDASSPPSSPNNDEENSMPPPSGGIQGAASSQSARKRKQAVSRALDLMNGTLPNQQQQHAMQASNYSSSSFGTYNLNHQYNVQASPLAHMRGNGSNMNGGGSLINSSRLRAGHGHSLMGAMDSPLRRHSNGQHNSNAVGSNGSNSALDSPSRLLVNSPISSVRDSGFETTMSMERSTTGCSDEAKDAKEQIMNEERGGESTLSMMGSPSKEALMRGTSHFGHHLQPHNFNQHHQQNHPQMQPQSQQGYQSGNSFLSPAGLNLQMAMGNQTSPLQQQLGGSGGGSAAQFLNYGLGNTPNRYADQNNGNFIYQRWGMSPSPNKMIRNGAGNLYYSGAHPGSHLQAGSTSTTNLDDPFDYSGNHFQTELEMTAELSNFNIPSESPSKMVYPQMIRNQFYQQPSMTTHHHPQFQHSHQQTLQQHAIHLNQGNGESHQMQYVNGHPYTINLATSNGFGAPP